MKNIKNYLKTILISFVFILLGLLLISALYYFDIINSSISSYLRIIYILFVIFITNSKLGKTNNKSGYLEGTKIGLIYIFIFFIISCLFFKSSIRPRLIIYYIIIIFTSILSNEYSKKKIKN